MNGLWALFSRLAGRSSGRTFSRYAVSEPYHRFANLIGVDSQKPDQNISELSPDDLEGKLAAVTAERDKLATEKAELYDRLLRSQAEFVNFRGRSDRERSDYLQFAA